MKAGGGSSRPRPSHVGVVGLVAVVLVAGCGVPVSAPLSTSVPLPRGVAVAPPRPLPLGVESIYSLFDEGQRADADAMLDDVWRIPRYRPVRLRTPLTWREDPYTDQYWRFLYYGMRPLSDLLWAHYRTPNDPRYRAKLIEILRSYVHYDARPRTVDRKGMDYPHAVAFRAMALTNIYVKLDRSHDLPADLRVSLRAALGRLGRSLADPANYEGGHNHGFSESAALLLLQTLFPDLAPRDAWGRLARARLHDFMNRIIDPDGVEIEKSPFYHFYVLDFALSLRSWAARAHAVLPADFDARVRAMIRYATDILWPDGTIPLFGSSVRLRPERSAELYAPLDVDHPEFEYALAAGDGGRPPRQRAVLFRASGQAVLRGRAAAGRNRSQLLFDVGMPSTAHSHRAALALLYYSHGRELLPDSGLYTYAPGVAADYFHTARAHNTVVVDGRPNGVGPIRAGRTVTGPAWAYQSGSAAVYPGVTHRRAVLLLAQDLVVVVDQLQALVPHRYTQLWHLFPGATLVGGPRRSSVHDERDQPVLGISQWGAPSTVGTWFGARNPMQGWYSAEYGKAVRTHALGYTAAGRSATFVTVLASGGHARKTPRVAASSGSDSVTLRVCGSVVAIRRIARPGERVTVAGAARCDG